MRSSAFGKINLHPNPTECNIALVLIYNDLHIAYNGFGQRTGAKAFPETDHHMVFYNSDEIVVADNDCWISKFTADFKPKKLGNVEKIDRFFYDPLYKRAVTVFGNLLFKHKQDAIYAFFDLLVSHWDELERLGFKSKYQKENILDMIAICEILHFELITSEIINRFTKRIEQELLRDLNVKGRSDFKSVSDILYDEVHTWPMIQKLSTIVWN